MLNFNTNIFWIIYVHNLQILNQSRTVEFKLYYLIFSENNNWKIYSRHQIIFPLLDYWHQWHLDRDSAGVQGGADWRGAPYNGL